MAQLFPELRDHGVHLVFQMEFLLLESNFLQVILFGHVVATVYFQ